MTLSTQISTIKYKKYILNNSIRDNIFNIYVKLLIINKSTEKKKIKKIEL